MHVSSNSSIFPSLFEVQQQLNISTEGETLKCEDLENYGFNSSYVSTKWPCIISEVEKSLEFLNKVTRINLSYGTIATCIIGITLNMMSLIVFLDEKLSYLSSTAYLSVLTVYDSSVLLLNFTIGVLRASFPSVNRVFQENEGLCRLHGVMVEIFSLLSVWVIVAYTIERFIAVYYPLKLSTLCTREKACRNITIITLTVTILSFYKVFVSGFEGDSVFGYEACVTTRWKFILAVYINVALNTWFPVVLITFFNIMLIRKIFKSMKERKKMANKSKTGISKSLLVVSCTYLALVLPVGILQTSELIWSGYHSPHPSIEEPMNSEYANYLSVKIKLKAFRSFFFTFYQLNFAVNFFLYVVIGKTFRSIFFSKLTKCKLTAKGNDTDIQRAVTIETIASNKDSTNDLSLSRSLDQSCKELDFNSSDSNVVVHQLDDINSINLVEQRCTEETCAS